MIKATKHEIANVVAKTNTFLHLTRTTSIFGFISTLRFHIDLNN